MKKVINITLGNIVFAIEQDAYDALALYLENIKSNLANNDDAAEIVADIESAVAEKFIARKRNEKMAVNTTDVNDVITEMGSPAEFADGGEGDSNEAEVRPSSQGEATTEPKRRLYRDADNSVIAGVASGLARYFDIDPVIVRLIFVISIFFNGLGILAYIILWLVVPAAETAVDKYAMRGERMTLKDISERVKKNIDDLDKADYEAAKGAWANTRSVLDKLFLVLGSVVKVVVRIARYVVGIALIVGGALGVAGMVSVYSVILLSEKVFFPNEVQVAIETLQGSALGVAAMISSFVMMSIPLIVLIIAGASLLAKRSFFTVQKSVTLAVIWIVAAVVAGTTSVLQVEQVMQKVGPIEGRFENSSFEVKWDNGVIYGDENHVRIIHEGSKEPVSQGGEGTDLSGRNLTDVPSSVFSARDSVVLDLSDNNLSGALPGEVRHLSELRVLNLSDNNFTGVPAEVGQLQKLEQLNLSNNPITGLPYEIGNLQNLQVLDLRGTNYAVVDLEVIKTSLPAGVEILTD